MSPRNLLIFVFLLAILSCMTNESSAAVKKSALAGRWYSSDPDTLSKQIDSLLAGTIERKGCGEPILLILPHAGYQYSGRTAASGYRKIGSPGKSIIDPRLIVIIGPSHHKSFHGCALITADYFETPLGRVKTDID